MKLLSRLLALIAVLAVFSCNPKPTDVMNETQQQKDSRMKWWRDATFGMFIHWGVYSVPAGIYKGVEYPGIGEWIMDQAKIPVEEYEVFARQFNPVRFDADEWVRIARDAGMKYIVITSKHHDGFCLWNSKVSGYDMVDFAPFGRDVLKELAQACKQAGIRLCFYHSIMDWHHPDARGESFTKYREEYLIPQLEELLSGDYGDVGVLWFDGEWISEWTEDQGKALYKHLRELKPDLIINNRVGKGRQGMQGMNKDQTYAGDFGTPEQEILGSASALDWESCMTMNDTWGFKANDQNWKSSEMLIHNLIDIIAKGGNYLLNVGPTSEGLIPAPSVDRLADMGRWVRVNTKAVYKTTRYKEYLEGEFIRYAAGERGVVYAYLLAWPGDEVRLSNVEPRTGSKIRMVGSDEMLEWSYDASSGLTVRFPESFQDPANRPCQHAWVLEIVTVK